MTAISGVAHFDGRILQHLQLRFIGFRPTSRDDARPLVLLTALSQELKVHRAFVCNVGQLTHDALLAKESIKILPTKLIHIIIQFVLEAAEHEFSGLLFLHGTRFVPSYLCSY